MAGSFLQTSRHGTVFYFRRRVPDDLRPRVGKPYLVKSLGTGVRRQAIIAARSLAVLTDDFFAYLRAMSDQKPNAQKFLQDFVNDPNLRLRLKAAGLQVALEERDRHAEMLEWEAASHAQQRESDRQQHERELALLMSSAALEPVKSHIKTTTISEAFNLYKATKITLGQAGQPGGWKDGEDTAKYDHWPHIQRLIEVVGSDKAIGTLTDEDVQNFFHDVVNRDGVTAQTKNQRLGRISTFLKWAHSKRYLTQDLAPILKWTGRLKVNHYQPFTVIDLKRLFESDDYREGRFKKAWQYWIPLLGLFTGARLNELAQLRLADIGTHDGIPTLAIHNEDGRRTKNEASIRTIPIHPTLIELGFLKLVEQRRADGSKRLFDLRENTKRVGDFTKDPSRYFTEYRRSAGVSGRPEAFDVKTGKWDGKSSKAFHSFRTTAISDMRRAGVPEERRKRLVGHAEGDVHNSTYRPEDLDAMFPMSVLLGDITQLKFEIEFSAPPTGMSV